jgi:hypothetical protein|tara:strand:- start:975 stop:1202 length:228 start_codon:yes stop_codon:yes gene_type:complete
MQTNLILKVTRWSHSKPWIGTEMAVANYQEAEQLAEKLNDIAKARGEDTVTYYVQATKLPVDSVKDTSNDDDIPF